MAEVCGICGQECGGPADLLEHIKGQHGVVPATTPQAPVAALPIAAKGTRRREPFICGICGAVFATRERLARHNLTVDHATVLTGHTAGRPIAGHPA